MAMPEVLTTKLHAYRFFVDEPDQAQKYAALRQRLEEAGNDFFNVISSTRDTSIRIAGTVELETRHIFSNQWNTRCGHRVFDWYEGIYPNRNLKTGHYLDITPEMRQLRQDVFKCGYCGKQYYKTDMEFCNNCLDSEFLKESEIHLLRLKPVGTKSFQHREPLTEEEKSILVPLYVEAQVKATTARRTAQLNRDIVDAQKGVQVAQNKLDGLQWLLDHKVFTDVIFYNHTGQFCFGWRNPVSNAVHTELTNLLREFPFDYEIKKEGDK